MNIEKTIAGDPISKGDVSRFQRRFGISEKAFEAFSPSMAASTDADNEVLIYGVIVPEDERAYYSKWLGDDSVLSGLSFRKALRAVKGEPLIRINSPGGDVWECSSIIQTIQEQDGDMKCIVDGLAASAASMAMAACQDVTMAAMSQVMIHSAWTFDWGNAKQLRKTADMLEKVDNQAAAFYGKRMNKTAKAVLSMLGDETWFTAEEAVKAGLGDRVFEADDTDDKLKKTESMASLAKARNERLTFYMNM